MKNALGVADSHLIERGRNSLHFKLLQLLEIPKGYERICPLDPPPSSEIEITFEISLTSYPSQDPQVINGLSINVNLEDQIRKIFNIGCMNDIFDAVKHD